ASRSSLGTPWGLAWALSNSFQSSLQNVGVSFSRNPVSCICSNLMSGCPWSEIGIGPGFQEAYTHISSCLDEVEDELNHDIVLGSENLGNATSNPPASKV